MRRILKFSTSLFLIIICSFGQILAQDTLLIPLKIKIGLEVSGPATYFIEKGNLNAEGYFAVDINEKTSALLGAGYLDYKYSQYNYNYLNNGIFLRAGVEFNLLKPEKAMGIYWGGLGIHYGISRFNSEITSFSYTDKYWGTTTSSIARKTNWGHFIEFTPGVRAELIKNISIGWTISLRMLLYTGAGKDARPIYFPGFGNGAKTISTGLNYFIVWNIPYKKITVITKKEEPEEDTEEPGATTGTPAQSAGRNNGVIRK
jgi:hypothetical protein